MTSLTGMAVVNYLAATGPATQNMLSDALGVSQSHLSRVLRNTPGIIKNDSVTPAIYSFDPGVIVEPVSASNEVPVTPNYTGVIQPNGGLRVDLAHFVPRPDTLGKQKWSEVAKGIDTWIIEMSRRGSIANRDKKALTTIAEALDQMAYTIQSRLAKGDFDA